MERPPNPYLVDYTIGRDKDNFFFMYDGESDEYWVTSSMIPWIEPKSYLLRTKSYKEAQEFFHAKIEETRKK